jgi:4-carboxymuconolactone decarboxylase
MVMSVLGMDPVKFPPPVKALYNRLAAKRRAKGEAFGGPYLALLNHPALAERVEALGFYLKFEGVLPRVVYQFIVLSVAQATGAAFEWHDHVQHALDAGLPRPLIDGIAERTNRSVPHPYELLHDIMSKALAWQPIPDALQARAVAEWGKDFGLLSDVCSDQSGLRHRPFRKGSTACDDVSGAGTHSKSPVDASPTVLPVRILPPRPRARIDLPI